MEPIQYPTMPMFPGYGEYFWHNLPYALPGLFTFIIGLVLGLIGLFRSFRRVDIGYYLSFAGTCFGIGFLGLVLSLRAVLLDQNDIIYWNTIMYPFVVLFGPASTLLIYYILERKYKVLLIAALLVFVVTIWAYIGIFQFKAFTGDFLKYSFGQYPVASIFLKPWAIVSSLAYFIIGIPCYYHYLKNHKIHEKKFLIVGHNLIIILVISNLPSFIGVPIFPGSTLAFIPLLLLGWGVFNSDFIDIKQFMFEKNGFFYILNALLGFILLIINIFAFQYLRPSYFSELQWYPYLIIPLISFFIISALGIFIGGVNTERPLNQYGAISLFLSSLQLIAFIINNIDIQPIISYRLEQIIYIFFAFIIPFQMRFVFLSLNRPLPKYTFLLDFASIFISIFSLSSYLFNGYYEYKWGRISSGGILIQFFGSIGLIAIGITVKEWWYCRKNQMISHLGNYSILYIVLNGLFFIGNIPSTIGFELYPPGNLSIFPTLILAYSLLRYGGDTIKTVSLSVSTRLVPFSILAVFFFLSLVWMITPIDTEISDRLIYFSFIGIPLTLNSFLFTFILIRPIASKIDETLDNLALSKKETEIQKTEVQDLNTFSNLVNNLSNLNEIFKEVSLYFYTKNNILSTWLFLPDESKSNLYPFEFNNQINISDNALKTIKEMKISLKDKELGGLLYLTYYRKKSLYLPKINKIEYKIDKEFFDSFQVKSLLYLPLIRMNECVGIFIFSNLHFEMKLTRKEISKMTILLNQIAGSIYTHHLLKQVENSRKEAEIEKGIAVIAKMESESSRKKTEELNLLIRKVNEATELNEIMKNIMEYVKQKFQLPYYSLFVLSQDENALMYANSILPDYVTDSQKRIMMNYRFPLDIENWNSIHWKSINQKFPIFIPDVELDIKTNAGKEILSILKHKSLLTLPIFLQNKPIGTLDFFSIEPILLSFRDVEELSMLSDQLAGVIQGSLLFRQIQEEKEKALFLKIEADSQKQQTEELNQLIKSLNEELNLNTIMQKVNKYVNQNYGIENHLLNQVDVGKESIYLIDNSFSILVSNEEMAKIKNIQIPIQNVKGIHGLAFKTQKLIFLPNLKTSNLTEEEKIIFSNLNINSLIILPIILNGEVIGILDFYNSQNKMDLNREDLSRLSSLGKQLAGIIYGSSIFKQVQEEKEKALLAKKEADLERKKSDKLLLNIFPFEIAKELKEKGKSEPVLFDSVSVMFTDFKGFTKIAEKLSPQELIKDLDACFIQFDKITERYKLEKLKTIGDSYMCAGGIPRKNKTHSIDCVLAALEIQAFMDQMKMLKEMMDLPYWELRLGIHTGPLIAGVIGEKKFTYDVWGDTVNTASRMESSGTPSKINISGDTYNLIKDFFDCEYRGEIEAKNKGSIEMYYVAGIKEKYSVGQDRKTPNPKFWFDYNNF
jgi:class 3 adenylate cyclase/putative methionine-R-sulfoxide reductase with GAF domain